MKTVSFALLLAVAFSSNLHGQLFGVQYGDKLIRIDQVAGTGSIVANLPTNLHFANSLEARDRESLFTIVSDSNDGFKDKLLRIDPSGAVPHFTIGPTLYTSGTGYMTFIDALAYHSDYGMLGIEVNDNLVRIDLETGRIDKIGQVSTPGRPIGIQGLVFSPDGLLYGWGVERHGLIRINPLDASFAIIGGAISAIQALEFSPDGSTLYGAREDLYTINVTTGAATKVGSGAGITDIRGIAFAVGAPVPEPVTAVAFLALLPGLLVRPRVR